MKTAAIIAEYNPFHSGHKFHIEETKAQTGADYILAIMSGHFVQRGAPALLDKYTRTHMALLGGVDVVIELPTVYATSSAEYFAQGAVTLAHRLGVVDVLSFGSEEGLATSFIDAASALLSHEKEMQETLRLLLKEGISYPAAKEQAALAHLTFSAKLQGLLSAPNNILGMEYCKALLALNSSITPFTITRRGQKFQDIHLPATSDHYASASAIRHAAACTNHTHTVSPSHDTALLAQITPFLPEECREIFCSALETGTFLTEDDLSMMLCYQLLLQSRNGFSQYLDCTPDLSDKICKNLSSYTGFSDFCSLLKSKDLTYARISRTLLHILLDITPPAFFGQSYSQRDYFLPYGHLLGFRKSAGELLSAIKKNSSIPLIAKMADAKNILKDGELEFLNQELLCTSIYEAVLRSKKKETALNELRQSPIII